MKTAFPTLQQSVKITLYSNIPFDNTYKNHSLISSLFKYNNTAIATGDNVKERFINTYKQVGQSSFPRYQKWTFTGDFNFNYGNGLVTSCTLELTPAQTNANYMKVVCGNDVYYYFITAISQSNYETYTLSLELDVLMTYQDEFLEGVKDIPVFTTRKHCHRYTNNGLYLHCADLKTGDSTFTGLKPSVISTTYQINPDGELYKLRNLQWLYICVDAKDSSSGATTPFNLDTYYKYNGIIHPLAMLVIPLNCNNLIFSDGTNTVTINHSSFVNILHNLVGSGQMHACKLSPYPPFKSATMTISKDGSDNYTITDTPSKMVIQDDGSGNHKNVLYTNTKTKIFGGGIAPAYHIPVILEEYRTNFKTSAITISSLKNGTAPTIKSSRYEDPKLLFSPFKKYTISATYGNGYEFYPELIYSDGVYKNNTFSFDTVCTCYIGDFNLSTYLSQQVDANGYYFFQNYQKENNGLSSNVNYTIPIGQDALQSFNLTQSQTFYQSKIASGITNAVAIGGGIASIVVGAGMTAGSGGSLSPMGIGMIAGGVTSIAGGFAGEVNAIKSTVAKIEDLKNTPDSINVQGSCYVNDNARYDNQMPYVAVYDVTEVIKHNADDFFYNYGYEIARDCYFNTELSYDNDTTRGIDNNLFGRTIFNYVQTNEDITNKINADIPLIAKKKLSSIFNNGITLWTFFGFDQIWRNALAYDDEYDIDFWLFKHELDNTEYSGNRYN